MLLLPQGMPGGGIHDLTNDTFTPISQLIKQISRRRDGFRDIGISSGDTVVIAHGGSEAFFTDLLALWSLGACCACVNPTLTAIELNNVCRFTGSTTVVINGDCPARGYSLEANTVDSVELSSGKKTTPAVDVESSHQRLDQPALILFTSGTTGEPKGVVHSFRSLLARIALNRNHIGDRAMKHSLCVLPTHFGHGLIGNSLTPLLCGGTLFLYGGGGMDSARELGHVLESREITFMSSVPYFWHLAMRLGRPPAQTSLERVHVGSAPLSASLWASIQTWTGTSSVHNLYGITETGNWFAGAGGDVLEPADGLVGTPWGGSVAVLDDDGQRLARGEGELLLQSPALMTGYLHRDDLTGQVLRDGWFHSGDRGVVDDHGIITLTGRLKSEINRAGMKIHPEEIDMLLDQHPDVIDACTFAVPDEHVGEYVGVAIVARKDSGLDTALLREWCRGRARSDCLPDRWYFIDSMPRTDRGKLERDKVAQLCLR